MAAFITNRMDDLMQRQRSGIYPGLGLELLSSRGANSFRGGLLEANNATGDVPTGSGIIVIPPCQKRLLSFILDQEVNVDQRSNAAEEKEYLFGEALAGVWY